MSFNETRDASTKYHSKLSFRLFNRNATFKTFCFAVTLDALDIFFPDGKKQKGKRKMKRGERKKIEIERARNLTLYRERSTDLFFHPRANPQTCSLTCDERT